jgi:hypothetical protein
MASTTDPTVVAGAPALAGGAEFDVEDVARADDGVPNTELVEDAAASALSPGPLRFRGCA